LWQADRWDEAQTGFILLLRKHPEDDDARRGLAELLNRRGFRFDANQQIRVLCGRPGVQATIDELRCLIVPSRAYQPFTEKPRVDEESWIKSMGELNVARALYGEGDVRDALTVLENGDLVARGNPAAVAFYGQVLLESQQYDRFENWLAQVSEKCRRYPAYWMAMGGWALRKQQAELAVRMFGEALVREPGDVSTHDRMHQALKAAGDLQAAERFDQRRTEVRNLVKMTRIIYGDPNIDPGTFVNLADLLDLIGRPLEAKSWRSLAAYKMGQGFQAAQQADFALRELLMKERQDAALATRMCGVDLSRYPMDIDRLIPQQTDVASSTADQSRPTQNTFPATPSASTPVFVNVASDVGLDFLYVNADPPKERYFLMHEAVGSGIACLDYDLDSAVDLYVGQGACNAPLGRGKQPNLLARNIGGHLITVTDHARCDDRGYTLGVTSGDWNQDGFPDLVVGNMTRNHLLINQGDGTFRPLEGDSSGTGDPLWDNGKYTSSLAIADVTGDHIPDMVEVTYLDDPQIYDPLDLGENGIPLRFPGPLHFQAVADRVFEGIGDGRFKGTELKTDSPSPGLGLLITDIDGRGGNDIFVANDMKANHFWIRSGAPNSKSSDFIDAAIARGVAYGPSGTALACMGIAAADFDENGYLDLHITNFTDQWTNQYMQNSENLFDDLTLPFGLDNSSHGMLGFGTEALDYDNNGTIDLVTGNGHIDDLSHEGKSFKMPTQFFVGDRSTLVETEVSGDPSYWKADHLTRGLVTLDWNNDGRADFATSDLKEPLALLENRTETNHHWLQLQLVGVDCERDAIGAQVTLHLSDGRRVKQRVQTGDGYMSKNQGLLMFGLGNADAIEQIEIRWPDGSDQVIGPIAVDRRWLITQDASPF
jgi:tetratricopeptide (TPR) repeat protein